MFFKALCSNIVPEGADPKTEPGALTVGAINYIDSTLYGFSKDSQDYFRAAMTLVNKESEKKFFKNFGKLSQSDRNIVQRDLYLNPKTREIMFDLRSLVLEGFYSDYHDPQYQGMTAWEYIGFAGKRVSDLKKDWTFLKVWKEWRARGGDASSAEGSTSS